MHRRPAIRPRRRPFPDVQGHIAPRARIMPGSLAPLAFVLIAWGVSPGSAQEILIYDAGSQHQTLANAVTSAGYGATEASSTGELIDLIYAGGPWDLLLLDIPDGAVGDDFALTVADHVATGGATILSYAAIASGSDGEILRSAFGLIDAAPYSPPQELLLWDPLHPIFAAPNPITGPLVPTLDPWPTDGATLAPAAGATAIAGFGPPTPLAAEGGIVIADTGVTVVNGFNYDNYELAVIEPLVVNEIVFLLGPAPTTPDFLRGDSNGDGSVDISDAVFTLASLFVPGAPPAVCLDAADANDDGGVDISDAVFALAALFGLGAPIPPPSVSCGGDPTGDALPCIVSPGCP